MKKTIIALVAVLAAAFSASAADYVYSVLLNRTDGVTVVMKFEDEPVAQIEGDDLKMTVTSTGETALYPIKDIVNFTFMKAEYLAVEDIAGDGTKVSFGLNANTLDVAGLPGADEIAVYDMTGKLCVRVASDSNGVASVDISGLEKGVYIVSAGNNTFKFIR